MQKTQNPCPRILLHSHRQKQQKEGLHLLAVFRIVTESGVCLLATQKPIKRHVGGKENLPRGGRTPVQRPTPHPTDNQGARAFIDGGRGLHAETAQSALRVVLKLVIGGLTSVILIVLSTVSLQFQDWFVPIALRPVLGIVAAYVMVTVWSSCS